MGRRTPGASQLLHFVTFEGSLVPPTNPTQLLVLLAFYLHLDFIFTPSLFQACCIFLHFSELPLFPQFAPHPCFLLLPWMIILTMHNAGRQSLFQISFHSTHCPLKCFFIIILHTGSLRACLLKNMPCVAFLILPAAA